MTKHFVLSMFMYQCILIILSWIPSTYCFYYLSLDGRWTASNGNNSIVVSANVPGGIYTDLVKTGALDDPYFRYNDLEYRWVALENWTYTRDFDVPNDFLSTTRISLVAHGLDTVGEVFINDQRVGTSNNMFVRYVFDVKDILKKENNTISVKFESAVLYAKQKHLEQLMYYVIPPVCPPPTEKGLCHVNYIRKMQCSFSWDWGPAFPSQGIWKSIGLEGYDKVIIRNLVVNTFPVIISNVFPTWAISVTVHLETVGTSPADGTLEVKLDENTLIKYTNVTVQPDIQGFAKIKFNITIPRNISIKQWWPNGYGDQPLYNLTVSYIEDSTEENTSKTVRIGFRTVELIQDVLDNDHGLSFYFRVNGIPIFAKGSNWIPADVFPERVTRDYIQNLLQSTKDANMNMLRVWGGGIYESDEFYHIADELGILIWQDLMFAASLYPVNDEFLYTVAEEVKQQIRRLQHHPSIIIWAGNNENEQALASQWWPVIGTRQEQYRNDYLKLYIKTIRPIVMKEDNSRQFLSSSPSNGLATEQAGWIAWDPQDTHFGDVHYYNYGKDGWDWHTYPRPRFVSEYGFQSYPSFETLKNISKPDDWTYPFSQFLEHRQHHALGGIEIKLSIIRHMNIPPYDAGEKGFKQLLYLSQINQAMSIKTETEYYRRCQSDIVKGEGLTRGALYWQLNDIWQAPSWSSIEYGGKWKMLHYFAVKFFAPLLASPFEDGKGNISVSVISDYLTPQRNLTLHTVVHRWDTFLPKLDIRTLFDQPPQSSQVVFTYPLDEILKKAKCSREECFFFFYLTNRDGEQEGPSNEIFLSPLNKAKGIQKPKVKVANVTKSTVTSETFDIHLEADAITPFLWLHAEDIKGHFSDNGFLATSSKFTVHFLTEEYIETEEMQRKLEIMTLMDS
ncbi:beta-mannosidase-like [Limulus polyphemus]|uniref:Beta-mannosidase n=1 Tax=Limulus polyphemus TaxID=6850 RepID=A0ABM1BXA9_LIMPO|nr:beta-mannosidase-like [Limulus polyphemus]